MLMGSLGTTIGATAVDATTLGLSIEWKLPSC